MSGNLRQFPGKVRQYSGDNPEKSGNSQAESGNVENGKEIFNGLKSRVQFELEFTKEGKKLVWCPRISSPAVPDFRIIEYNSNNLFQTSLIDYSSVVFCQLESTDTLNSFDTSIPFWRLTVTITLCCPFFNLYSGVLQLLK